jgi:hypothetical protein
MAKFFAVLVALAIVFWGFSFLAAMFAPLFTTLLNSLPF